MIPAKEIPRVTEKSQEEIEQIIDLGRASNQPEDVITFALGCINLACWKPKALVEHRVTISNLPSRWLIYQIPLPKAKTTHKPIVEKLFILCYVSSFVGFTSNKMNYHELMKKIYGPDYVKLTIEFIKLVVGTGASEKTIIQAFEQVETYLPILMQYDYYKEEYQNQLVISRYICEHFDELKEGLLEAGVLINNNIRTQIHLLKIRTIRILNHDFFDDIYGSENKKNMIEQINKLDNYPKTGFHDLYTKCQIYKILLDSLPTRIYENNSNNSSLQPNLNNFLIELLFDPTLEDSAQKNFIEIMCDLQNFSGNTTNAYISTYSAWKPFSQTISTLKEAIDKYIVWFHKNKCQIARKISAMSYIEDFPMDSSVDVEQDSMEEFILEEGKDCGTSGLFPCVSIIAVVKEENDKTVLISHSAFGFQNYLEEIQQTYKNADISYYFVGGVFNNLPEYISLITDYDIVIKDIIMCTPINASVSCLVSLRNGSLQVLYSEKIESPNLYLNRGKTRGREETAEDINNKREKKHKEIIFFPKESKESDDKNFSMRTNALNSKLN